MLPSWELSTSCQLDSGSSTMTAVMVELCDTTLLRRFVSDAFAATLVRDTPCSEMYNVISFHLIRKDNCKFC